MPKKKADELEFMDVWYPIQVKQKDKVGPNPTDGVKDGIKRSLLVERDGGPSAVVVAAVSVRDAK